MNTLVANNDSMAQIIANSQIFSQRFKQNAKARFDLV
jgi:hypothetical protein